MSYHDYKVGQQVCLVPGVTFYGIIQAAIREADTENHDKLRDAFPEAWADLQARYNAPGGLLQSESIEEVSLSLTRPIILLRTEHCQGCEWPSCPGGPSDKVT